MTKRMRSRSWRMQLSATRSAPPSARNGKTTSTVGSDCRKSRKIEHCIDRPQGLRASVRPVRCGVAPPGRPAVSSTCGDERSRARHRRSARRSLRVTLRDRRPSAGANHPDRVRGPCRRLHQGRGAVRIALEIDLLGAAARRGAALDAGDAVYPRDRVRAAGADPTGGEPRQRRPGIATHVHGELQASVSRATGCTPDTSAAAPAGRALPRRGIGPPACRAARPSWAPATPRSAGEPRMPGRHRATRRSLRPHGQVCVANQARTSPASSTAEVAS